MVTLTYLTATFLFFLPSAYLRYTPKPKSTVIDYYIDGKTKPEHYDVHLTTHVEDCEKDCAFEGKINITVVVNEDAVKPNEKVTSIQLYNYALTKISLCVLTDEEGLKIPASYSYDNITEILTVSAADNHVLKLNQKYYLYFEYSAIHNDDMFGFYKSFYYTPEGSKRWLLTTQFQPNDARNAYPCFDEPKYKATYEMAITVSKAVIDQGYHVLFNTPLMKKVEDENKVTFFFKKTPYPLSTYFVAFIVSDFEGSKAINFVSDYGPEKNVQKEFRTWGEKKYLDAGDAEFPQLIGTTAIKILSDYLGIGFAYPKMDQAGVPDFAAGAMENWGLVTYRERMLFYNKEKASESTKKDIVVVISHELTHQWFGNLVTLHSWNYIWLNEGFATYFAFFVSQKIAESIFNSKWNTLGQMIIDETQLRAMESDALEHSRPLSVKLENPNIAGSYFDSISYAKGASVIRMWSHAIGDEVFRRGLNLYLNERKEKNSIPMNLLKSFEKACNDTICMDQSEFGLVSDLFEDWHTTAGYPVISVEKINKTSYTISQEQFLWYQHKTLILNNKWNVPITYAVASNPQFDVTKPSFWLKKSENSIVINLDKEEKWIILNNQHTGYYRINYDKENWIAIINQLQEDHSKIHEYNRAQLINDAFAFARSTYKDYNVDYDIAFTLLEYLNNEENYIPWNSASISFSFLNNKLTESSQYQKFKDYVIHLLKPRYDTLGLTKTNETAHLDNLLRMLIGNWACSLGYSKCIEEALRLYKEPRNISPDVKKIVYCTAIREGGDEVWDNVWNLYQKSQDNIEQTVYLSSLGCSKSHKKLDEFLRKTITEVSGIRKQDYTATFASVYKNGNVQDALTFLINKFEEIAENFSGIDPLGSLLIGISANLNTEKDLNSMKKLQQKISVSEIENVRVAEVSVGKAIEIVESNIKWINLKRGSIENWLRNRIFTY